MQISSLNKDENAYALQGVVSACEEYKFLSEVVKISFDKNRNIIE